jgi:hypothetical protein
MENTARLFNCASCKSQVIICSHCDRGNIYCKPCAPLARKKSQLGAAKRYQNTREGKLNHAARQRAYMLRKKQKMTHHTSGKPPPNDAIPDTPTMMVTVAEKNNFTAANLVEVCNFCGKCCTKFLRIDFLLTKNKPLTASYWPSGP